MRPKIAAVCSTINRDSLRGMVRSWKESCEPGDKLFLLGDGVKPDEKDCESVIGIEMGKVGLYGHQNIRTFLNGMLSPTFTHFILIGDDDEWRAGALQRARYMLLPGMILTMPISWDETGKMAEHYFGRFVSDKKKARQHTGGTRPFIPVDPPFIWDNLNEDRFLQQEAYNRFPAAYLPVSIHVCRVGRPAGSGDPGGP